MKKFFIVFLMLVLSFCMLTGFDAVAYAEENVGPESVETMAENENSMLTPEDIIDNADIPEEDKQIIKDLISKLQSYTSQSDSFFIKFVLPLIVACALCLVVGIIILLPLLRKNEENKTVKSMLKKLKSQYEEQKAELEKYKVEFDANKIGEKIKDFIKSELNKISALLQQKLAENNVELDKIEAGLISIINGALNAWKASPEAVACLTQSATAIELKNLSIKCSKLEAYVLEKYGEEALKEISTL